MMKIAGREGFSDYCVRLPMYCGHQYKRCPSLIFVFVGGIVGPVRCLCLWPPGGSDSIPFIFPVP